MSQTAPSAVRVGGAARRGGMLLAALLAAGALLAALCASADGAARQLRTGVSYVYVLDSEPAAFENVRRAGGTRVLTPLEWGYVAPEQRPGSWNPADPADPHYDWRAYDEWVTDAVAAGLVPVLQVRGGPIWASRCATESFDTPCDLDPADLAAFATAAARR